MKALFFGGAFNPLTNAHLHLAEEVKDVFCFDKVIFVPTKSKYILKTEEKEFSFSEEERYQMLKDVSFDHDFMEVSDIEINEKEQPRTYLTMKKIQESEGYSLTLMIGSDWLDSLRTKWMYVDEILDEFSLLVIRRNYDDIDKIIEKDPYLNKRKDKIQFYDPKGDYQNVSSSYVRMLLKDFDKNDKEIHSLVPQKVYDDIRRMQR